MSSSMDLLQVAARQESEAIVAYANAARELAFARARRAVLAESVLEEAQTHGTESSPALLKCLSAIERELAAATQIVRTMAADYADKI